MSTENLRMREAVGTLVEKLDPVFTRPGVSIDASKMPWDQKEFLFRDMGFGVPLITEDIASKTKAAIAADVARWREVDAQKTWIVPVSDYRDNIPNEYVH